MSTPLPEIIGETFDGIKILKPVTEPTSFTVDEIRKTIAKVMQDHYDRVAEEDGKADVSTNKAAFRD